MDSRINENPGRTFDLVLQVACPPSEHADPEVLWKFPQDFGDQEALRTVPKFCFPFDVARISQNQVGQNFTFVLTDIESKQRFGFCRLTSGCRVCICLLSYLPWFEIYYKLLNTLADYLTKQQENDLNDMLKSLYTLPVPKPNTAVNLSVRVKNRSLEDVVILNVDMNTLESPSNDLHNLPSDVVSTLKGKLKKQSTATGCGVARAFLRSQAALFGSYRDALRYKPGEPITFCEESFVNHRSSTMRAFLANAVNLQLFKQFIEGRLAKLNTGRGFTDVFEEEITEGGFCGSNTRSYQQWMTTVKKGGALFNTAVTKTKSHVKQGFRGMKSRLKQKPDEDDVSCGGGSPTSTKSLSPRRLQKRRKQYDSRILMGCPDFVLDDDDEPDNGSKISSEDSGEAPSYTEDSDGSCDLERDSAPVEKMTLLEEILDSLSTSCAEEGRLSAAKSLDFFRSMDDLDYKNTKTSTPHSESKQTHEDTAGSSSRVCGDGGSACPSGESLGWHLGQDDSALHGKHLPPSPRRQGSCTQLMSTPTRPRSRTDHPTHMSIQDPPVTSPPDTRGLRSTSLPTQSATPSCSPASFLPLRGALRRKGHHSQTGAQQDQQRPTLIPWQCEEEEEDEEEKEKGLLEEIESLCRLSTVLHTSLQLTHVHSSADKT
ncbi:DENN domain-containing protein 1B isoform X6 [Denticeps clupeoides]|uniref:DENN domain-containing protein 1B isoform X6 n=1 Tax=Denticeps clupeoides TaxID=299321 RepID=UPI0010A46EDE|nr:DENN domain-containing protein 1B isoform X6 [Denticeps clupeoides]